MPNDLREKKHDIIDLLIGLHLHAPVRAQQPTQQMMASGLSFRAKAVTTLVTAAKDSAARANCVAGAARSRSAKTQQFTALAATIQPRNH